MKKLILLFIITLFLVSCASYTPPEQTKIVDNMSFNQNFDQVWNKTIAWLNKYDLLVDNMDKSAGFIKASGPLNNLAGVNIDTWSGINSTNPVAICGKCGSMGVNFTPTKVRANIFVIKSDNASSPDAGSSPIQANVRVKMEFFDIKPEPACIEFSCVSNGTVEKMLFDFIGR